MNTEKCWDGEESKMAAGAAAVIFGEEYLGGMSSDGIPAGIFGLFGRKGVHLWQFCAIIKAEDSAAGHENHLSIDVMLPLSLHPIHLR